jgi:hypothetical protein
MTKLFQQGIEAVRDLPAERQDMAGELLLTLATNEPVIALTADQIEDLRLSIADVEARSLCRREGSGRDLEKIRSMKVRYSPRALGHLTGIAEYLRDRNPDAALLIGARIRETIGLLVVYRVDISDEDVLIILGIYHGAQLR